MQKSRPDVNIYDFLTDEEKGMIWFSVLCVFLAGGDSAIIFFGTEFSTLRWFFRMVGAGGRAVGAIQGEDGGVIS